MKDSEKGLFLYLAPADSSYHIEKGNEYALQLRPKIGLLYLAATLRERRDLPCEIWDQTIKPYDLADVLKACDSGKYKFIGFYCAVSMESNVIRYIKAIRQAHKNRIPVLVGGPSFPDAKDFLEAGCDVVCNGEGEDTICEIVDHINGKKSLEAIKGISYMSAGRPVKNEPRPLIDKLDSIPFPDHGAADMGAYHDFYIFTMRKPYMTMISSRGCPFDCAFCDSRSLWNRQYRLRSVNNVLEEIDILVKKYGVRYLAFQDDVFGMDYEWTEEFCGRLKSRHYDLKWMCILHPFSFKKDPDGMLANLRTAGCDTLSLGLQSAHPQILKNLNRYPEEPLYVKKLVSVSRRLDMLTLINFIFGSPGETKETIKATIDFALDTKPNYARFYNMVILPGSRLAKQYGADGRLCEMTREEIGEWCRLATRKFYFKTDNLARNIYYILRNNPGWFLVGCRHLFSVADSIGVGKGKEE